MQIELGRAVRTLGGAAIYAAAFEVSTNNGSTFASTGFTVALDGSRTRVILTPADGGTAWAAAGANLRVDYARVMPFHPSINTDEINTERLLDGLFYDDQQHRGATNFAPGSRAGNVLQGTNRMGAGVAGVPVATRGAAKLVATERWTGTRNVTVRMMAADGVTVLAERTLAVTGT